MIYTGSFRDINRETYDEIWLIVRIAKNIPKGDNIKFKPELSPPKELLYKYLDMKKAGNWNSTAFKEMYIPCFLKHIAASKEGRQAMNELLKTGRQKSILLVCYCSDENMCHRSIIKGMLQGAAIRLGKTDLVDMRVDYSDYFNKYLEIRNKL